jgi:hypothetical protein
MTRISVCCAAVLFAGCATAPPPPLTSASPASPQAAEGARIPSQTSLHADDVTRKTATLLSAAQKEQVHWDAYGPVSGNPGEEPKDNAQPEMKHEHH